MNANSLPGYDAWKTDAPEMTAKEELDAIERDQEQQEALRETIAAVLSEGAAKTAIEAIAKGSVPRMSIDYGSAA